MCKEEGENEVRGGRKEFIQIGKLFMGLEAQGEDELILLHLLDHWWINYPQLLEV